MAEKEEDMRTGWWLGAFVLVSFGATAQQSVRIPEEYDKLIQSRTTVGTLGPDLFGDEISFYDGSLQFQQTDVSLPGNNGLDVSVGRRFAVKQDLVKQGAFGDWDWEIPRLHGVFSTAGWTVPVPVGQPASTAQQRCSRYGTPPGASGVGGGSFSAGEFWNGSFLKLAGGGGGEILRRNASTPVPTDGYEYLMHRREVWIMPTLVTDRTGNTVTYNWSTSEPWKLTSMVASDGRSLSFTYVSGSNRVASVSDGSRTWIPSCVKAERSRHSARRCESQARATSRAIH